MIFRRLRVIVADPTIRRRKSRKLVELVRGALHGHPGVRFGSGVKLTGAGSFVLQRGCSLRSGVRMYAAEHAQIEISSGVSIGDRCVLNSETSIFIGPGSMLSWQSQVLDTDFHQIDRAGLTPAPVSLPIVVGAHVLVGTSAIILKGVAIGDNTVIGAGAVVVRSVAGGTIVAGNPARPVAALAGWR